MSPAHLNLNLKWKWGFSSNHQPTNGKTVFPPTGPERGFERNVATRVVHRSLRVRWDREGTVVDAMDTRVKESVCLVGTRGRLIDREGKGRGSVDIMAVVPPAGTRQGCPWVELEWNLSPPQTWRETVSYTDQNHRSHHFFSTINWRKEELV